jgi:hypothetical protein
MGEAALALALELEMPRPPSARLTLGRQVLAPLGWVYRTASPGRRRWA